MKRFLILTVLFMLMATSAHGALMRYSGTFSATVREYRYNETYFPQEDIYGEWSLTADLDTLELGDIIPLDSFYSSFSNTVFTPENVVATVKLYSGVKVLRFDGAPEYIGTGNPLWLSSDDDDFSISYRTYGRVDPSAFYIVTEGINRSFLMDDNYKYIKSGTWEASAVPVPTALWLLGSAFTCLISIYKRKKK